MLCVEGLALAYPGFSLRVSLKVARGETLALIGPSGSGKTSVLKAVAGLLPVRGGRIWINGEDVTRLPPERRRVGVLFQDYALFPHLSVFDNVAFGLVEARWPRPKIEARVRELLKLVQLTPHADKKPHQLSGGEQQRVALARALAPKPRILLLDEPLGALDLRLREALLLELKRVLAEEGTTALYVTHDQAEAFALAHRVTVMRTGRIVQTDAPAALYKHPADAWTARFLGHKNLLDPAAATALGLPPGHWLLPPFALRPGEGEAASVKEVLFLGPRTGLWLDYKGVRLYWEGPLFPPPNPGETLPLSVDLSQAVEVAP